VHDILYLQILVISLYETSTYNRWLHLLWQFENWDEHPITMPLVLANKPLIWNLNTFRFVCLKFKSFKSSFLDSFKTNIF
jgi:hypothetical protein